MKTIITSMIISFTLMINVLNMENNVQAKEVSLNGNTKIEASNS